MAEKKFTEEQVKGATGMALSIATLEPRAQELVQLQTNAFVAGMEAARLLNGPRPTREGT